MYGGDIVKSVVSCIILYFGAGNQDFLSLIFKCLKVWIREAQSWVLFTMFLFFLLSFFSNIWS